MVVFSFFPISAMPKFAITKYRNFQFPNNKVRFSKDCFIILAISDTGIPQQFAKQEFKFGTLPFVCRHIFMSLFFSQAVHYFSFSKAVYTIFKKQKYLFNLKLFVCCTDKNNLFLIVQHLMVIP